MHIWTKNCVMSRTDFRNVLLEQWLTQGNITLQLFEISDKYLYWEPVYYLIIMLTPWLGELASLQQCFDKG